MSHYALDANTISFLMKGKFWLRERVLAETNGGGYVVIPAIAYYEVRRGLIDLGSRRRLAEFDAICQWLRVS